MINIRKEGMGSITLPVLKSLEIEDRKVPEIGYPDLACPQLSLFICIVRHRQALFRSVIKSMLSRFTASLKSFMLRSMSDDDVETLSPDAVRTLSHCKQLRNFLFEGRICIPAQDWWVLRKVHDELDRAIFILPAYPQSKAERTFYVSFPRRSWPQQLII